MNINIPFTAEELKETMEKLEPKIVHVNRNTYDSILQHLNFEPINLMINNYLANNQALVFNKNQFEEMAKYKPLILRDIANKY